jgi:hypothetical protein
VTFVQNLVASVRSGSHRKEELASGLQAGAKCADRLLTKEQSSKGFIPGSRQLNYEAGKASESVILRE